MGDAACARSALERLNPCHCRFPRRLSRTMHEELMNGAVSVDDGRVSVNDEAALASPAMDALVRAAVFGDQEFRDDARWLIWEIGQIVGVIPSSIHDLYMARGRGEVGGFTVPAINVRGMTYDTGRSLFRTSMQLEAGAFLCEIARSEIAYTDQRPAEYVTVLIAAALREGWRGPLFIQGDHFQVSAKKFAVDPVTEVNAVKALAREAIAAGFYNIDVDTSTLVDLSKPNLDEQQRTNYEQAADIALYVRSEQPDGIDISLGGEIGEVGTENSTVEELHALHGRIQPYTGAHRAGRRGPFQDQRAVGNHTRRRSARGWNHRRRADRFRNPGASLRVARQKYGLAGAVQHGASTLPDSAFHNFPRTETAEIHLATNFQTMLYDQIPGRFGTRSMSGSGRTRRTSAKRRTPMSSSSTRLARRRLGRSSGASGILTGSVKAELAAAYDDKFSFLFTQLGGWRHRDAVAKFVKPVRQHLRSRTRAWSMVAAAPDDADLSD